METGDAGETRRTDRHLRERPLRDYLGGGETLFHVLTNHRVGVERVGEETTQIRPADDCGAVAGLTDRRVLLLVGDPDGHDGDFVASLPYADVTEATAAAETLTASLRLETALGAAWSFTAREADVDEVAAFLADACDGWGEVTTALDDLDDHCDALAEARDASNWAAFDERLTAAESALETARDGADEAPVDGVVDRIERLSTELYRLVRDRHVGRGRELLSEAERLLEDGDFEGSYDRIETARERLQDGTDVATTHDVDDEPAQTGLTAADDLEATVTARPLEAACEAAEAVDETADPADRAAALEDALDAYRVVAPLVTAEGTPFDGDPATARAETESVIADLVDARVECARERRAAGEWEWAADNDEAAYELLSAAREDLDRALELAAAFPPGDADALRRERDELVEDIDPLVIRDELSRANERSEN